jgi:hypothetical protein
MSLTRFSSCSVVARRSPGFLLRRDLGAAGEGGRRRPRLLRAAGVSMAAAALFLALTASSALAAPGHGYLGGPKNYTVSRHKKSGEKTSVARAKGKNGYEEVIIIGRTEGGKREEVVVGGPKGSIGHVSAADGPNGGIGHVTVTGPSGG